MFVVLRVLRLDMVEYICVFARGVAGVFLYWADGITACACVWFFKWGWCLAYPCLASCFGWPVFGCILSYFMHGCVVSVLYFAWCGLWLFVWF